MKEQIEQTLMQIQMQKQQMNSSLIEVDSALDALSKTKEAYKLIGNILIKSESSKLKEELEEKKKLVNIQLESITKQEKQLKEQLK